MWSHTAHQFLCTQAIICLHTPICSTRPLLTVSIGTEDTPVQMCFNGPLFYPILSTSVTNGPDIDPAVVTFGPQQSDLIWMLPGFPLSEKLPLLPV